jgi:hypothetical protein
VAPIGSPIGHYRSFSGSAARLGRYKAAASELSVPSLV